MPPLPLMSSTAIMRAGARLRPGIGDAAGDGMDDADLHRARLRAQHRRRGEGGGGGAGEDGRRVTNEGWCGMVSSGGVAMREYSGATIRMLWWRHGTGAELAGMERMGWNNRTRLRASSSRRSRRNPTRKRFGFGRKPALINIDLQKAYTAVGEFVTAYETDPKQLDLRQRARRAVPRQGAARWCGPTSPTWIPGRIAASGARAPTRRIRCRTSRSARAAPSSTTGSSSTGKRDIIINKRMASAFHETNLGSLFTFHRVRHGGRDGRLDLGLRARDRRRQPVAQLSAPSSPRSASPTSTRARISPISMTWR